MHAAWKQLLSKWQNTKLCLSAPTWRSTLADCTSILWPDTHHFRNLPLNYIVLHWPTEQQLWLVAKHFRLPQVPTCGRSRRRWQEALCINLHRHPTLETSSSFCTWQHTKLSAMQIYSSAPKSQRSTGTNVHNIASQLHSSWRIQCTRPTQMHKSSFKSLLFKVNSVHVGQSGCEEISKHMHRCKTPVSGDMLHLLLWTVQQV